MDSTRRTNHEHSCLHCCCQIEDHSHIAWLNVRLIGRADAANTDCVPVGHGFDCVAAMWTSVLQTNSMWKNCPFTVSQLLLWMTEV